MSAITFRLPDAKYERLKQLAKSQNISVNKLLDELSTIALVSYDAKTSFEVRAKKGDKNRGLEILDKL
ncbi:toxin-antitoxin system HicB family antitoxin [Arcobacter cloacae]|jgi:predicted DNA-binding ribbon-helix-helix protein|uniref:Toxin-antitoxin system HicB family antitoxin n=1 Tax=Arcobacter cloacae TaxID=1054034 RepID=A0A4Q0ZQ60_9BACT|nr:toxin-antitoxin system HicB family antitoxin [Arcobacter cloacae]RXJ85966.1 toxin-antitoxin system HicB family antitoxin [Arcobacter cloacae]